VTVEGKRRLGLVVHDESAPAADVAGTVASAAVARGLETTAVPWRGPLPDGVDLVVGIGGDGTLLAAVDLALGGGLPVVGINLGNVGYLADIEPGMVEAMLDGVVSGTLQEHSRMTVRATVTDGRSWTGINEVVVEKLETRRLVQIAVDINENYFTTYRADGIITATPLGSTAYSLSAGGPVLDPALDALIVTPVAPHSLLSRSIVLRPDAVVRYTVELERPVRLNVDGREAAVLGEGDIVTVEAGELRARFLSLGEHPFPQAVRHQFGLDHA
jgi:NAD+ kinase